MRESRQVDDERFGSVRCGASAVVHVYFRISHKGFDGVYSCLVSG